MNQGNSKEPDLLTEVFSTLRLKGELYFRAELSGPFALEVPQDRQLIRFHLVCRGSCWVKTESMDQPVLLTAGSLAVIPHGVSQVLSSEPARPPMPLAALLDQNPPDSASVLRFGRGEPETELLCGFCSFDDPGLHPVLAHLPPVILLKREDLDEEPWLKAAVQLMALEAGLAGQGMRGILTRALEIAFVQIVRRSSWDREGNGYLAALKDAGLSQALFSMHARPEVRWTVDRLAREAGMSRARFAKTFAGAVGLTPLDYLTQWRLMKARQLLQTTALGMEEVAARCGYASLPSFSRRFHAVYGIRPGAFRAMRLGRSRPENR